MGSVPEDEANDVLAPLLKADIAAEKTAGKEGMVGVRVDATQVGRALEVMRENGLPRERFAGMGQVFKKEGLISSPLEERARYIYALSQELTNTLSQMDGVLAARVHVVLPERGGVGENTTPSTAAVFIKHQAGYNLDALQPQIRKLVTHAIPGLTEDRVSIALVSAQPAAAASAAGHATRQVLGIEVGEGSSVTLLAWLALLILLVLALAGALAYVLWRYGVPRRARPERREPVAEAR
mgnify:CR=1 FL=1